MKKFGILIFVTALILGVGVAGLFTFGRLDSGVFNFCLTKTTKGSGLVVTDARDLRDFTGVDVSGVFQVEIVAGKDFSVEVESDDNIIPLITTQVRKGVLHIDTDGRLSTETGMKVRISAPDIDSIVASGASRIDLAGVQNDSLRIDISGAAKTTVSGETRFLSAELSGAGFVDAERLKAHEAEVDASGASKALVFARSEVRLDASGASKIVYAGNPTTAQKRSSGASSIRAHSAR